VIVIVGEEKALGRLKQCCRNWNANNVKLLPFQPREKLPEMLAAADVGLVIQKQNVISFNMPSKIQVLLASGRPILASVPANGTAARAVKKSGGGIVVPPEDPETLAATILELYNDPATVTLLGNRSRQHALQYYSFDQALNRYEELFSDIQKKRLLAAVQKS
ncbi:glycosyltransferase, partial [Moorena sp. SIO3I6]